MTVAPSREAGREKTRGILYAVASLLLWGLSPLYWKQLSHVPVLETLMHRIVWSAAFLAAWLSWRGRWKDLTAALARPKTLLALSATTLLIGANWFVYVWAIGAGRLLDASLGYFINPLVNVLLGMVFLGERLRRWQGLALLLAAAAVLNLVLARGAAPWLALFLAFSFGGYVLLRKVVSVDAPVGLSVETFLLAIPASAALLYKGTSGAGAFLRTGAPTDLLLVGTVLVTALPLLWYTEGARRLSLKTLGVIQYLSPTCQFLLGAFLYKEPLAPARLAAFGLIWAALAVYTIDALLASRLKPYECPPPLD